MSSLGIALSGGGHRATAWALGALVGLVDSKGPLDVPTSISSVSGGSITNGFVAMRCDFAEVQRDDFENDVAAPLAAKVAAVGTVFGHAAADDVKVGIFRLGKAIALLLGLLILSVLGLAAAVLLGAQAALTTIAMLAAVETVLFLASCFTFLVLLRQRGPVSRDGYDAFYGKLQLGELKRKTEHVFCATDLQFAEHVYLSERFVYAWRVGVGRPSDLHLADAVLASAAFPAAFPPVVLPTSRFDFEFGAEAARERLVLLDGGVYDNMAEQWFTGLPKRLSGKDRDEHAKERARRLSTVSRLQAAPDHLLVINGAPAFPDKPFKFGWFPAWEFEALGRAVMALYDQTTSLRRAGIVSSAIGHAQRGGSRRAAIVNLTTSPRDAVSGAPESTGDAAYAARLATAKRLVETPLGDGGAAVDWATVVERNSKVATTLEPLGVGVVADLMQHAAILTAIQCHLYFDYPLPPANEWVARFGRQRFVALAEGRSSFA